MRPGLPSAEAAPLDVLGGDGLARPQPLVALDDPAERRDRRGVPVAAERAEVERLGERRVTHQPEVDLRGREIAAVDRTAKDGPGIPLSGHALALLSWGRTAEMDTSLVWPSREKVAGCPRIR
jgi:hypothetical protein